MLTRKQERNIESYLTTYQETISMAESKAVHKGVEEFSIKSYAYDKAIVQGGQTPSEVEEYVVKKILSMEQADNELIAMLQQIEIVTIALKSLTPEEYDIVKLKYFKDLGNEDIAAKFGYTERTVTNRRKNILEKLYNSGMALLL